jgi:hypothetical protein
LIWLFWIGYFGSQDSIYGNSPVFSIQPLSTLLKDLKYLVATSHKPHTFVCFESVTWSSLDEKSFARLWQSKKKQSLSDNQSEEERQERKILCSPLAKQEEAVSF